jgi:hypothetical protein
VDLRPQDKEQYLRLIALAFAHNNDEVQARERLANLEEPAIESSVVKLTEKYIEQDHDIRDIKALVTLSRALGQTTSVMVAFVATPTPEPTATATPAPTPTARPTRTPTPSTPIPTATTTFTPSPTSTSSPTPTDTAVPTLTATRTPTGTATPTSTSTATPTPTPGPDSPFGVAQSVVLCAEDEATEEGLLRIYVRDRLNVGVPGVKITVIWSGGQDSFYTGFKPEIDPGYADFRMRPGQRYQVELTGLESVGDLPEVNIDDSTLCPDSPDEIDPSWQIVFQQGASR